MPRHYSGSRAVHRRFDPGEYLPDDLSQLLRRRMSEFGGVALLLLAVAIAVALASWSVEDPSLSHATRAPVRNLLGAPGAITADLLMQLFGLASIAVLTPVAIWGWWLIGHRRIDREKLRLASWIIGIVFAAGFAACWPVTKTWPLPTGLGGVFGDGLLRMAASFVGGTLGESGRLVTALFTGGIAALALAMSSGLLIATAPQPNRRYAEDDQRADDPTETDRGTALLGAITHAFLSLRARLRPQRERGPRIHDRGYRPSARQSAYDEDDWEAPPAPRTPVRRAAAEAPPMPVRREPIMEPRRQSPPVPPYQEAPIERGPQPRPEFEPDLPEQDELPPWQDDAYQPEFEPEPEPEPEPAPPPPPRSQARTRPAPAVRGRAADGYEFPPLDLLGEPRHDPAARLSSAQMQENAAVLENVLEDFGVRGEITEVHPGPVVTLYELEPAPGIKSSRVIGLSDDIARSMSAISARVAVVPGRNAIGIELPNPKREKVLLRELLAAPEFAKSSAKLPICLGKTIGGEPVIVDLARMPHLLIAGTTGSGKSVAINTMILSLLYRLKPEECRLIMVDPKMLELSVYEGIPHLLTPVVTDPRKAVVALKWAVKEMEERYKAMAKLGVRNIDGFNARVTQAAAKGEVISRTVQTGFDRETGEAIYEREDMDLKPLPYIVVIVDEMADLMMVAGKDIEGAIQRLAQMARAAGIHIVMATQRPSVDVITGTIKANFPTRVSFQVTSKIDSRTILGEQGAEALLGQGDMLYMAGGGRISRVHGPFCSDEEVEHVVAHLKTQGAPDYLETITTEEDETEAGGELGPDADESDLFKKAVSVVMRDKKASTSYIQRRLQIGYNRAASLMERMEKEGIVGPANHAGKREIMVGAGAERDY